MSDLDSRLRYFKDKIKMELVKIREDIGETRYKLYVLMVDSCNDYDELRDMAELEMQLDMLKYTKEQILNKLKEHNKSIEDIRLEYELGMQDNDIGYEENGEIEDVKRESERVLELIDEAESSLLWENSADDVEGNLGEYVSNDIDDGGIDEIDDIEGIDDYINDDENDEYEIYGDIEDDDIEGIDDYIGDDENYDIDEIDDIEGIDDYIGDDENYDIDEIDDIEGIDDYIGDEDNEYEIYDDIDENNIEGIEDYIDTDLDNIDDDLDMDSIEGIDDYIGDDVDSTEKDLSSYIDDEEVEMDNIDDYLIEDTTDSIFKNTENKEDIKINNGYRDISINNMFDNGTERGRKTQSMFNSIYKSINKAEKFINSTSKKAKKGIKDKVKNMDYFKLDDDYIDF